MMLIPEVINLTHREMEFVKNNINLLDEKVKALQEDKVKYQESVSSVIEKAKEFEKSS